MLDQKNERFFALLLLFSLFIFPILILFLFAPADKYLEKD